MNIIRTMLTTVVLVIDHLKIIRLRIKPGTGWYWGALGWGHWLVLRVLEGSGGTVWYQRVLWRTIGYWGYWVVQGGTWGYWEVLGGTVGSWGSSDGTAATSLLA